jgi:hypothetical protein
MTTTLEPLPQVAVAVGVSIPIHTARLIISARVTLVAVR